MANREKFYFYAPTWDFPPEGPLKLGNVLSSIKKPERPLCCLNPSDDCSIFSTEQQSVKLTNDQLQHGKLSVSTKIMSIFGLSVEASPSLQNKNEETFAFDRMKTTQFTPTPGYLQACIDTESVHRFLGATRYRKPVYIITGIKIVTGAQAATLKSRSKGGSVGVEIDATVYSGGMIPLGGGPSVDVQTTKSASTAWENSGDFVFAYRAIRVVVAKATNLVQSEDDYRKGAMLGNEEIEEHRRPALEIANVDWPDIEIHGYDTEQLLDDVDVLYCTIPREDDD